MLFAFVLLCFTAGSALAQKTTYSCPADQDGFFPDPVQCDKYHDCYRGTIETKICPDGLVFDHNQAPKIEQCNYPFLVTCPEGSELQYPITSSIQCPRMNGYFEHEDPSNCYEYYECTHGSFVLRKCHDDLVFDELTGTCVWEHSGFRTDCVKRIPILEDGFQCPNITRDPHADVSYLNVRFVKPDDCRYFYVCIAGKDPELKGCPEGFVFNDLTVQCEPPENVPDCKNYYNDGPNGPIA